MLPDKKECTTRYVFGKLTTRKLQRRRFWVHHSLLLWSNLALTVGCDIYGTCRYICRCILYVDCIVSSDARRFPDGPPSLSGPYPPNTSAVVVSFSEDIPTGAILWTADEIQICSLQQRDPHVHCAPYRSRRGRPRLELVFGCCRSEHRFRVPVVHGL